MTRTFLCSGQSNAVGRGTGGAWDISPLVTTWNSRNDILDATANLGDFFKVAERDTQPFVNGRNNMFVHACDRIARTLNEPVRMILVAKGGKPIAEWYSGGGPKVMLQRILNVWDETGLTGPVDGFFWHQGESDGNTPYDTYKARFDAITRTLRNQGIMTATTPIIVGEGSASHTDMNAKMNRLAREDAYIECAPIKDLATSDGTHFTGAALVNVGYIYASIWLTMIGYVPPPPPDPEDPPPDPEDPPPASNLGSFTLDAGKIVVRNGRRTVLDTSGKLVNLLKTKRTFSFNAVFPDVEKGYCRWFQWNNSRTFNASNDTETYQVHTEEVPATTAFAQEYAPAEVAIGSQAGADFFMGRMKLLRTAAPSHNWRNLPLVVLPPENVWFNVTGSVLLEQGRGFSRVLHVYLRGGVLYMRVQQSVGNPPDGWGWTGYEHPTVGFARSGLNVSHGGKRGLPVWMNADSRRKMADRTYTIESQSPLGFSNWDAIRNTTNVTDPTNYRSEYSVQIEGQFGRVARG